MQRVGYSVHGHNVCDDLPVLVTSVVHSPGVAAHLVALASMFFGRAHSLHDFIGGPALGWEDLKGVGAGFCVLLPEFGTVLGLFLVNLAVDKRKFYRTLK